MWLILQSFKGTMNQLSIARDPIPQSQLVTHLLDIVKDASEDEVLHGRARGFHHDPNEHRPHLHEKYNKLRVFVFGKACAA